MRYENDRILSVKYISSDNNWMRLKPIEEQFVYYLLSSDIEGQAFTSEKSNKSTFNWMWKDIRKRDSFVYCRMWWLRVMIKDNYSQEQEEKVIIINLRFLYIVFW